MQINPGDPRAVRLIMRWPRCNPGPIYFTSLLQLLHLQPIAALEVLAALAEHLAGRSSVLETQVEGWGSIDDVSPTPAHRQQLVSPPPPQTPHPGPKTCPLAQNKPQPPGQNEPQASPPPPSDSDPPPSASSATTGFPFGVPLHAHQLNIVTPPPFLYLHRIVPCAHTRQFPLQLLNCPLRLA